jgi:hypothetical protein
MVNDFIKVLSVLILALPIINASEYLSKEAAEEGIGRGCKESFACSTGFIFISDKNGVDVNANGILLAPHCILTTKHTLTGRVIPHQASFTTYPDIPGYVKEIGDEGISPERRKNLNSFGSSMDLKKIYFHPDENVDLAIIHLKYPISNVKFLPLYLEKPPKLFLGFFVSYAPVYALPDTENLVVKDTRHIAILDVEEVPLSIQKKEGGDMPPLPFLISKFRLEGDVHDQTNRSLTPTPNMHRLKAFTLPSDSGAAFIVKVQNQYYIAGVHKGRAVLPEPQEEANVCSAIIPLYPYKDWILATIKRSSK